MHRRHSLAALGAGLAAAMLAGCANMLVPSAIHLTEAELAARLEKAFPLDRRLLDMLDVNVRAPRLKLLPDTNRMAVDLDVGASDRLLGSKLAGKLVFESGLRFEPSDQSLRLERVRVNELRLDGAGSTGRGLGQRLAGVLAESMLEGLPIYHLSPERQEQLRKAGVRPGTVSINSRGLEIPLVPAGR
jgi:hypothetical protein